MITQLCEAWENLIDFLLPRICCGCGTRVMQQQWLVCEQCLDSVPPLREPICKICGCPDAEIKATGRCTDCPMGKAYFVQARGYAEYGGIARTLIEKLKYERRLEYAPLMALSIAGLISDKLKLDTDLITAVPLHPTRQRDRGFNQANVIARHLSDITGLPHSESVLRRDKPTPSQTRLKKSERRDNIRGAFSCAGPEETESRRIILIDDVYTTGSTLNECARIMMENGAESVHCLAYARAPLAN